jgi:hypothetical protein
MSEPARTAPTRTAPSPDEAGLPLHRDDAEQLHRLLGTVEDWLLHASFEALDDLGGFLAGLAWAPFRPPERLVADLITDLGQHGVALRSALRAARQGPTTTQTGPAA